MTKLVSARLLVTSWALADAPEAFALWGDPAVMRFVGAPHRDVSESRAALVEAIASEERHGVCLWRVVARTGEPLGCCGFHVYEGPGSRRPSTRWLELAYHLRPSAWGRGYATEAATGCLRHAKALGFSHVVALCDPANLGSAHVLDKLAFADDGIEGEQTRHLLVL